MLLLYHLYSTDKHISFFMPYQEIKIDPLIKLNLS